jgi:ACS family sodium-dependent inorganic phosphate cotransporter
MTIAIIAIGEEYEWSERGRGVVLGAFFVGYMLTQVAAGWASDRWQCGGQVLLVGVCTWSLVTILTPVFIRMGGLTGAVLARLLLGLAEGVAFPSVHSMLAARTSAGRMNAAVAMVNTAGFVGAVVALVASAAVVAWLGWPFVFYGFGVVGLVWSVPWIVYLVVVDKRVVIVAAGREEVAHKAPIETDTEDHSPIPMSPTTRRRHHQTTVSTQYNHTTHPVTWTIARMLQTRAFLAMFCCYYCNSWGFWMITTWLPSFLQSRYAVSMQSLGFMSILPYIMQGVSGMASGIAFDMLMARTRCSKKGGRLFAQSLAMLAPSLALTLLITVVKTHTGAITLLTGALALNALSTVGVGINHIDLAPMQAGAVYGWLNTVGVVAGAVSVSVTGFILDRFGGARGWSVVFAIAIVHYLFGMVVWCVFGEFDVVVPPGV